MTNLRLFPVARRDGYCTFLFLKSHRILCSFLHTFTLSQHSHLRFMISQPASSDIVSSQSSPVASLASDSEVGISAIEIGILLVLIVFYRSSRWLRLFLILFNTTVKSKT